MKVPRSQRTAPLEKPHTQSLLSAFSTCADDTKGVPVYHEEPLHLADASSALERLTKIDWSFTDDETRFLGHDLHPYPAKFIPQLPGTLISLLSTRGELVYDPFGGSGTTALEAIRLGRRAVSLDANPVAALIGRVKTARVDHEATTELHLLHGALRTLANSMPNDPKRLIELNQDHAPEIANREKWFPDTSFGELANIRSRISKLQSPVARDVAYLALSRTVLGASFQDSETRYKSVPREIPVGTTTVSFLREFESVMRSVSRNASATRYGVSKFLTGDVRNVSAETISDGSVDLVTTSPPYGNAMDYHLYHRFRLLWLGFDPIAFGKQEIGSHLKHQREANGFESYFRDMTSALRGICRVLKHGRYAVLVIGDSMYDGKKFDTAKLLARESSSLGFDTCGVIERDVHKTKRSFTPAGRRASKESLLILRKKDRPATVALIPPPYKLYPYERELRTREGAPENSANSLHLSLGELSRSRSMVFTHEIVHATGFREPTWQAVLENGTASSPAARKDPKYATHGIHPYKGKFYPQLAKALINQLRLPHGARILDPFCGSGTTLLEGYLNGFATYGCDVHPVAAKIASAKTSILEEEPDVVSGIVSGIFHAIDRAPEIMPDTLDQFAPECLDEIQNWFAAPVARKLNWLLRTIRSASNGASRDFLEVILSSIVREVSQQDPADLRIRYRKEMLRDADVLGLFGSQLTNQFSRVERFWKTRGYAPNPFFPAKVVAGDNRRHETYSALGLAENSVDLVLTSPPYAMALPYIDTDRLSLLALFNLGGSQRRPIEETLIGSREISGGAKKALEQEFTDKEVLPRPCVDFVRNLADKIGSSPDAGFRKQNMPALIHRFLKDMDSVFVQLNRVCKPGAQAMVVIGDSKMTVGGRDIRIPSTDFLESIAHSRGFSLLERLEISVTTENLRHIKNAIRENVVLRFTKVN